MIYLICFSPGEDDEGGERCSLNSHTLAVNKLSRKPLLLEDHNHNAESFFSLLFCLSLLCEYVMFPTLQLLPRYSLESLRRSQPETVKIVLSVSTTKPVISCPSYPIIGPGGYIANSRAIALEVPASVSKD